MNAKIVVANLIFALLVFSSGCSKPDHLKNFQGDWIFVEFNHEGKILTAKTLKVMSAKINKNEFRMYAGGELGDDYTISVDASKTPAEIDLVYASGENKGKRELGIYAFEDKKLKLCIAGSGGLRPTEFVVQADAGQSLMVLDRK